MRTVFVALVSKKFSTKLRFLAKTVLELEIIANPRQMETQRANKMQNIFISKTELIRIFI